MTKILTRQCSIPDIGGDYKEARCDLNVIYAVQFDIDLYNYIDVVLRKLKMGTLRDEQKSKVTKVTLYPKKYQAANPPATHLANLSIGSLQYGQSFVITPPIIRLMPPPLGLGLSE